jgi:hypothetical protein
VHVVTCNYRLNPRGPISVNTDPAIDENEACDGRGVRKEGIEMLYNNSPFVNAIRTNSKHLDVQGRYSCSYPYPPKTPSTIS